VKKILEESVKKNLQRTFSTSQIFGLEKCGKAAHAIHSKTHFIGVLCPVPYVLTPLINIGSFIIDRSDSVLEILE
jgi:hypothetical protein